MTLCASGEMALGGSTTDRSVNLELGCAATAAICMNRTDVRTLAAKASGAIAMSDFYGKSNPPTTLGQSYEGGFYTGVINIGGGVCYYLLIAPNATGCASCAWKTTRTLTSGTGSLVNGYTNTRSPMENATHPAGNWTATRSISGYSDWYLPARDELNIMYTNKGSMPAGEGFAVNCYFSSTENNTCCACFQDFTDGTYRGRLTKISLGPVRAVRRHPV
jgi:hypothetical protein